MGFAAGIKRSIFKMTMKMIIIITMRNKIVQEDSLQTSDNLLSPNHLIQWLLSAGGAFCASKCDTISPGHQS